MPGNKKTTARGAMVLAVPPTFRAALPAPGAGCDALFEARPPHSAIQRARGDALGLDNGARTVDAY